MAGNNRQLIATLELRSVGKGKMNTAGGVRLARETIKSRLRSSGEGITISASGETLQIYSDGRTYIPESRWNVIKSDMAKSGITFEAELPDRRQKSYELLFDENEGLKKQIGDLTTRAEQAEKGLEEWKGVAESYRVDADDGKKTISDMRGSMHLLGLFESPEEEKDFELEIGAHLAEKLAKGQIKAVSKIIDEAEDAIAECAKSCGVEKVQIYRIMSVGLDFEETGEYKRSKDRIESALSLLKQIESNPGMKPFVKTEEAESTVKLFESKKKIHHDVKHLVENLVGHREIHYILESGETEDKHFINLYIPVPYRADLKSTKRVEGDLHIVGLDSIESFYHSDGELHGVPIEFSRHNSNGVTYYQFRMPKSKVDRKKAEKIKEKFKKNIVESQKNTIIYRLGVRIFVSELTSFGENQEEEAAYVEPPAPEPEPKPDRMGVDDVVYRKISDQLSRRNVKDFSDPLSLFSRRGDYTPTRAALRAAVILSMIERSVARNYMIDFVEKELPEMGAYKRKGLTEIDYAIKGLMKMGLVRRAERGVYELTQNAR